MLRDELELVQDIGDDVILDSDEQDPRKVKVPGIGNVKDSEVSFSLNSKSLSLFNTFIFSFLG